MTEPQGRPIDALLKEERRFAPPEAFRARAHVRDESVYEEAERDPEGYWARWAEELEWFEKWDRVLEWNPPHARWFVNGKINASVNCVDRHIRGPRRNKAAIIWEGEPGDTRTLTYFDLHREVNRFANVLKSLGVKKGDRVTLYLPMIPELPIAMLACARIGAPHSVVFAGFSPQALASRMEDAGSRFLVTCDGFYRRGKVVPLKAQADEAIRLLAGKQDVEAVVVVRRTGDEVPFTPGRDRWWHELMEQAERLCPPEPMDAEDMLFMMYTSGTTGRPKGIVHTTGGYLTGAYATTKWVFDLQEDDVYWCMADIGWITGHSYIVYGPLANGATVVMYEGAPDWPDKDRPWVIVEKYGVTVFYTAPTAIRAFAADGPEYPRRHDLSSLRLLGSVGEPINPEAWMWYHEHIGGGRCPIVDTWWQTETGAIMITPLPGVTVTKPGSATRPFPGIKAAVLDDQGNPVPPGQGGGYLAILRPWPSMLRGIWGDEQRYVNTYWSKWGRDVYYPGDGAKIDEDGYFWVLGRVDDVMNVAGHRLSTMEIESALVSHPAVAEAAVIAAPHELKGQVPVGFVILEAGRQGSPELEAELKEHVAKVISPIARPDRVLFVPDLPKTRSGKIMRRLLRDIVEGRELGDTTTLRDPDVPEQLRQMYAGRS
ncbi:acetyl-coenzyme A synthetase [Thermaerobacter marianensis DSM 12885]|uniref:Acetyl-coenzyme A synthetase n=1 Tax=Thermaerobacter marianensis (strain ATCC 700841 / DSM 12885 / JCM 10246 / 7p75a) TaxID=644966 RepID=E6SGL7_THEM7|nr:acetate--CoA ligase [Thermaerobacter marianensis]ADU50563.1 acetyl-coenzyme A synthetase [Thermaerobacter marianensis DSM 12885]